MQESLRTYILNQNEPVLIKGVLKWKFLDWGLEEWNIALNVVGTLKFREGKNCLSSGIQWEHTTPTKQMSFNEFVALEKNTITSPNWYYYDYKYLKDIKISAIEEEIHWNDFGFPELSAKDSTIWIGSTGAHTPCHQDTYGCNLVAQLLGRKLWLLFPPSEDLQRTRIPYEESSIYSKLNFFSPDGKQFKDLSCLKNCRMFILNPGDVLLVPNKWWHYVENLEHAISVNTWIGLPSDDENRLSEAIVQTLMKQFTQNLSEHDKTFLINPNNLDSINAGTIYHQLSLLEVCTRRCTNLISPYPHVCNTTLLDGIIQTIDIVDQASLENFLTLQKERFHIQIPINTDDSFAYKKLIDFVNTICATDVVELIKNKLKEP